MPLHTQISPDTSKDQTDPGPKYYYRQTISNWDHMWQQMWQMCVQWHRFQHLFEAKTNLTDLYLRVVCVLLPNLSHSCAECFHESLVLEVEQVEFLRHPICPAWASCLFCRAIKTRVVFFESFSISFQTLVVYLPDVCVSVNLVQRRIDYRMVPVRLGDWLTVKLVEGQIVALKL